MEITRTQTQEEGADNVNSTFKKSVLWNPCGDTLILRLAVLVFTYPGIGRQGLET